MDSTDLEQPHLCSEKKVGRPRCTVAHQKILAAVNEELARAGYSGLTVEAVAQRAKVGKATIYRRWSGKEELLLDALLVHACAELDFKSTGDLREDIRNHMQALIRFLSGPARDPFRALIAAAQSDPKLARQFDEAWYKKHRAGFDAAVKEAGENFDYDVLYGPIYARLIFNQPLDAALVNASLKDHS